VDERDVRGVRKGGEGRLRGGERGERREAEVGERLDRGTLKRKKYETGGLKIYIRGER